MLVWTEVQTQTSLPIVVLLFLKRALVTIFCQASCFFNVKWLSLNLELVFVKFLMKLLSTIFYSTILYIYVFNNSISYTTFFDDQKFVTHLFFFFCDESCGKKSKQQSSRPLYYIKEYHIMKKEKKITAPY